jgi:hypothetical protein
MPLPHGIVDAPDLSSVMQQVTQAARVKWNGAQRAGSRLSQEDDYYALLEVPRDATPEHIKKQVCRPAHAAALTSMLREKCPLATACWPCRGTSCRKWCALWCSL